MQKIEKQVVAYTSACHGLNHILELTYAAVLIGIAQEFGFGLFVLGLLATISGLALGATALPSGFLADRIGERQLLMFYCLGTGIASIGVGLSPNIYILGIALIFLGLALGIYHPVGAAFVARVATHRGLAFGYLGVGGNLGLALGPILAGTIASLLGWRASYLIFAIPAILLAALLHSLARTEIPSAPQAIAPADPEKTLLRATILPLVLIFGAAVLNGFVYRGVITFLPLYLSQRIHFTFLQLGSMALAGTFTTIALLFGVGGQFVGGYLSERRRREGLMVVIAMATIPPLLVMGSSEGLVLMVAAITFAFFFFMGQPVYNSLIADYSPAAWRGRTFGIYFLVVFGLGSFSPSILGYIAEQLGTNWIFLTSAGFAFMALMCVAFLLARVLTISRQGKAYHSDNV